MAWEDRQSRIHRFQMLQSHRPDYTFHYAASERLLRLALVGNWGNAALTRFAFDMALLRAKLNLRRSAGGKSLIDAREFDVQIRACIDRLPDLIGKLSGIFDRFAVIHLAEAAEESQLRRVFPIQQTVFFTNEDVAIAWLEESRRVAIRPALTTG